MLISLTLAALSLGYLLFHLFLRQGLENRPRRIAAMEKKKVSILIAARNEEQNITYCLGALLKQTYPRELMEIIVIDDHSTDRTAALARACAAKFSNIRVVDAPAVRSGGSPKKTALTAGIASAQGEILLFTDADCAVPTKWVDLFQQAFDRETDVLASWVLPSEGKNILAQVELLDTLALQLIGAGAMQQRKPFLANGANLAYRRQVYDAIGGFQGIDGMGSGDDDLLMQKIRKQNTIHTRFLFHPEAVVATAPNSTWKEFFQQRLRWSSKTRAYPFPLRLLEFIVFCYYLLLLLSIPLAIFSLIPWWVPLAAIGLKLSLDGALIRKGATAVGRTFSWNIFLLSSALHLLYIPVIGLAGLSGRYRWKNRRYRRGVLISP